MRHGSLDCGQDLQALEEWLEGHQEVRPLGVAIRAAIDPQTVLWYMDDTRPPINPGPALAHHSSYRRRIGPYPGYFALDSYYLSNIKYEYFGYLNPIANIGNSIYVYRVTKDDANRLRYRLELPTLGDEREEETRTNDRGFQSHVYKDSSGKTFNYTLFVPFDYTGDRSYPLIVALNGFGDRGYGGKQYLRVGLRRRSRESRTLSSFLPFIPKARRGLGVRTPRISS